MKLYGTYTVVISNKDVGIDDFGADFRVHRLLIIQDINRVVPSFRMVVVDDIGTLTHLSALDSVFRKFDIMIRPVSEDVSDEDNHFQFRVYRIKPKSIWSTSALFDVVGLLNIDGLFEPTRCRGFNDTMANILKQIASELDTIDETEISPSLDDEEFVLVQPQMTNAEWLKDIGEFLYSKGYGYKVYIKVRNGKKIFTVKPLNELFNAGVKKTFVINDEPIEDMNPVFMYRIFTNEVVRTVLPSIYGYYNYENGEYVSETIDLDDYLSLERYLVMDMNDVGKRSSIKYFGRTIDGMDTPEMAKSHYYGHIPDLVKMWIESWGIPNICPGDIVKVMFPQVGEANIGYMYSGLWMVERVIQDFGKVWRTRLLLTRGSIDYDTDLRGISLVESNNVVGKV